MYIMKFISVPVVIVSFMIGIFCVYHTAPASKVVLIYPIPEKKNTIQYKDKSDTCFSFAEKMVDCPNDSSKINTIPVQN